MNSITQDMKFRYSLMRYAEKYGVDAYSMDLGYEVHKYNHESETVTTIGSFTVNSLSNYEKSTLEMEYRAAWEDHLLNGECYNDGEPRSYCNTSSWPG